LGQAVARRSSRRKAAGGQHLCIVAMKCQLVAALVLSLASLGFSATYKFPKSLQENLVLRLESDSGVSTDAENNLMADESEPAVLGWEDLSGNNRHAASNSTHDGNALQRAKNKLEDGTRHTDEMWKLPRAKKRSAAKLHDSAPALVTCPILNKPALFFDGDDYMFIPVSSKGDKLTPLRKGFTVVTLIQVKSTETQETDKKGEGQEHFFNHWLGFGHPGVMSDSQYTLHSRGEDDETVFGKDGKPKPKKKKTGPAGGMISARLVPTMHDKNTPSVREHAEIEAKFLLDQPTIVTFGGTGKKIFGRMNGEEKGVDGKKWKPASQGFTEGGWTYKGKIDPHEDAPKSPFYLGAGPSSKHLIDFTGEGAFGLMYGVLVFNKKLDAKQMHLAETYLACHFGLEAKCDKAAAEAAGMVGHGEL